MTNLKISLGRFLQIVVAMLMLGTISFAQVSVTFPTVGGTAGTEKLAPITVGSLTGQNVTAFSFTINYDKTKIELLGVDVAGTLTADNAPTVNADVSNGKLVVAWASATPLSAPSGGTLLNLKVKFIAAGVEALNSADFLFNAGTPAAAVTAGSATTASLLVQGGAVAASQGEQILIPILVTEITSDQNVLSYDFKTSYNNSIINITGYELANTLSADGSASINLNTPGQVSFAWASGTKITGSGTLLYLKATTVGFGTTDLVFDNFKFNAGVPTSVAEKGVIAVGEVNVAPTLTFNPLLTSYSVSEGQALSIQLVGADVNTGQQATLKYSATGMPTGATLNEDTGLFTWTPGYQQAGSYSVTFKVTDSDGLFATKVAAIVVSNINTAPSFTATGATQMGDVSVIGGHTLTFTFKAIDAENDPISYYKTEPTPAASSIDPVTGVFTWTPPANASGTFQVVILASDGELTTISRIATVTVTPNTKPVLAAIDAQTGKEGLALTFTASATDADGDPITYSFTSSPEITGTPLPVLDGATGVFEWTPGFTQAGSYTLTVSATDGIESVTKEVSVVIADSNRVPTLEAVADAEVAENVKLSIQLVAADLDTDNTHTFSFTSVPELTGATMSATGLFEWTPTYAQAGVYNVTFKVTDNKGAFAEKTAKITVTDVNRAPLLTLDPVSPYSVGRNKLLSIALVGTDPDTDNTLTYSAVGLPEGATLNATTGAFAWTPTTAGTYTVTFKVTDNYGLDASAEAVITVINPNAPVFTPVEDKTVAEGSLLTFTVSATDPDGDAIVYSTKGTLPEGATFDADTKTFSWTPGYLQAGTYTVTFSASDGVDASDLQVKITVTDTNRNPSLTLTPAAPFTIPEGTLFTVKLNGTDPDTDNTLAYSATGLPTGATVNATSGNFTWTPSYTQAGSYSVTFTVTDNKGGSASVTAAFTVTNTNRAPVFTTVLPAGRVVPVHNVPVAWSFFYTASDPDGDPLSFSLEAAPAGASITASGIFSIIPTKDQAGKSYVITVKVSDGSLSASTSQTLKISDTVTGVEDQFGGIPTEFVLLQNYPNPFNPTTSIQFGLPKESHVRLSVFNLLGQEVAQLVNASMGAGYHKVNFDASKLNTGMYIYKIEASDFVSVRKMLLVK